MSALDPTRKNEPENKPKPAREERATEPAPERLDFSKLDLTIEKVEERIAPGETNVFDK